MDGKRSRHPLTDEALDREIESALGIEPSSEFLARVRTRIASEPVGGSWRPVLRGWGIQRVVATAVAGIVIAWVAVSQWTNDARPLVSEPAVRVATAPPAVERPERPAAVVTARAQAVPHRAMAAPMITRVRFSEPMFSDEDRRAFDLLMAAVQEGRVAPMPETKDANESQELLELRLEPLVIEPLPQIARVDDKGERQ